MLVHQFNAEIFSVLIALKTIYTTKNKNAADLWGIATDDMKYGDSLTVDILTNTQ